MLKVRLIPCLLLKEGILVKSVKFQTYRPVGNPLTAIQFFNTWATDEIIFLDITPNKKYRSIRLDNNLKEMKSLADYTAYISKYCFIPLTVGGGIKTINDMHTLFNSGADKISINTITHHNPKILKKAAETFGNQALVVSIDVIRHNNKKYEVVTQYGKKYTGKNPITWAQKVEKLGAGEILLTSINRDGSMKGYDLHLLRMVANAVNIPVIASGGVGKWQHLVDGVKKGHASAVAAANIFHFSEQSTKKAKDFMHKANINVRKTNFITTNIYGS